MPGAGAACPAAPLKARRKMLGVRPALQGLDSGIPGVVTGHPVLSPRGAFRPPSWASVHHEGGSGHNRGMQSIVRQAGGAE
jgi:hypothetical protein